MANVLAETLIDIKYIFVESKYLEKYFFPFYT